MKIAVPTTQPDMEGQVGLLKDSPFLLAIDVDRMEYRDFANPLVDPNDTLKKTSLVLWLVIEKIQLLLVAESGQAIPNYLGSGGVQVIDGITGSVGDALTEFVQLGIAETCVIPCEAIEE